MYLIMNYFSQKNRKNFFYYLTSIQLVTIFTEVTTQSIVQLIKKTII